MGVPVSQIVIKIESVCTQQKHNYSSSTNEHTRHLLQTLIFILPVNETKTEPTNLFRSTVSLRRVLSVHSPGNRMVRNRAMLKTEPQTNWKDSRYFSNARYASSCSALRQPQTQQLSRGADGTPRNIKSRTNSPIPTAQYAKFSVCSYAKIRSRLCDSTCEHSAIGIHNYLGIRIRSNRTRATDETDMERIDKLESVWCKLEVHFVIDDSTFQ